MSRNLAPLLAVCITLAGLLPAKADDSLKGVAMIPVRLLAFATGAVVGTPIAVVRKTASNTTEMSGELSGKSDNPLLRGGSALVILPFAVFKGGLEGLYMGTANSWKNSSEKPFSKDSFSLGDMD
ncbi:MAG: hypothetical protein K2X27_27450 [Candidatus Obscuribacterales bacterium]|nr:hypothetical protein [Candidatus Obscuribacterales bacterium]